jgi:hypothetical protein
MGVVRKKLDELVSESRERGASANARMIVDEEDELSQGRELVRERLRKLRQASLQATAPIQKRCELLAELRGVAAQSTDQIGEQDERRPDARRRSASCARTVVLP